MDYRLHRPAYDVSFTVKNTGPVEGGDVPQLYLHLPESAKSPPSLLKGFTDVTLRPGETKRVTIPLSRYDLSIWDVVAQGWKRGDAGGSKPMEISIGHSSRNLKLKGKIQVK